MPDDKAAGHFASPLLQRWYAGRMPRKLVHYHGRKGAVQYMTVLGTAHTPTSLAAKTGLSKSHISRVLAHKAPASAKTVRRLARVLRVKATVLAALLGVRL